MRILSLWITRKDDDWPELLVAWDETSAEENPEGWEADCENALLRVGDDIKDQRFLTIDIFDGAREAFRTKVIPAEVTVVTG